MNASRREVSSCACGPGPQQCLYLRPLPHGHGALRDVPWGFLFFLPMFLAMSENQPIIPRKLAYRKLLLPTVLRQITIRRRKARARPLFLPRVDR